MKAAPIIVNWHAENAPIYSADFQPHGKGRLATGGGDNNVRLWRIDAEGEDRNVEYLCTMAKHIQTVNVVRWAPRGDVLASAGDDGNVIIWALHSKNAKPVFGEDGTEDKETWRPKHMCRSSGHEIYDLAWSPDGVYFITGSMDNVARIYNAQTGQLIRQIAEHQHYVQGVAWDPLNEYIATQSSDRSVHIYTLKTKDGAYTLDNRDEDLRSVGKNLRMDLPGRRISSHSPAPPEMGLRQQFAAEMSTSAILGSPVPSCPGTPTSIALPMNPPSTISHSRRSSFGPSSPSMSMRRSASPAPSIPLPAVMPMEASPKPYSIGLGVKNAHIYSNDTLKSFFRRLTFTPDGSLLFTPAGQYQSQLKGTEESAKTIYEVTNTVYIYSRGGINKPPIAHLPGHKKPSVVVKCSPVYYTPRKASPPTKNITIDTSSEDTMSALPDPVIPKSATPSVMDPPPTLPQTDSSGPTSSPKPKPVEMDTHSSAAPGPMMAFSLPYRMVYAVATEDSVLMYDTQQQTPLCIVSNLHCATFTDLTWSNDGLTLLMTSSDGFCSTLTFAPGELGQVYTGDVPTAKRPSLSTAASSSQNTPMATPTAVAPSSPFSGHKRTSSTVAPSPLAAPSPSIRPSSPTRSNSTSSVATQSSHAPGTIISNPTLVGSSMPGVTAGSNVGFVGGVPIATPPQTPLSTNEGVSGAKRDASESQRDDGVEKKRRRLAPTLVPAEEIDPASAPAGGSGP
ncbi:WD domain-containing protein [Drepanopeziza brunnea f. sp. 'multigermtubi' MB_m1]|uniref:WD domain-containing protein n=1 Tax=Marssonina brunnea f. sp. multigermtubi (strain MB_m1) TaxID=1072389 RepID=K1X9Q2_MARBU|nr:WD domain-containing protein [Drepanopeziza brunnea f. sp. 'multigermtubi' MB_m1]EKD21811.1 WD domain-containing protein [Drepanopeziza brunnea f. sp. 'multigermtubi' MB_m1]